MIILYAKTVKREKTEYILIRISLLMLSFESK